MDIRNRRALHASAREAVAADPGQPKQVVLIYAGTSCLLSLLSSILSYYLDGQIADTGGLRNMGLRSILSTIQTVLPIVQTLVMLGLELGYHRAALMIARGQESGPRTLLAGFRRFGPMIRALFIQGMIYFAIGTIGTQLASYLFLMLPVSDSFYSQLMPLLESDAALDQAALTQQLLALDETALVSLAYSLIPFMLICLAVFALMAIPTFYRYRMVSFCLADGEGCGALAAMRASRTMLRRNRFALFRLDLSLWWYYLLQGFVTVLCYGGIILSMLGIELPLPAIVDLFLFPVLSLLAQFVIHYFVLNRVQTTYAMAYEALRSEPDQPRKENLPFAI